MLFNDNTKIENKNKFIVIDGINGTGKSTLIKGLKEYFESKNQKITLGKEPGGTPAGEELRNIVLGTPQKLTPETKFFIMSASRAEYVDKVVKKAINEDSFFISDRFFYSSLAFQSYAEGLDFEFVYNTSKIATKNTFPDIVFILDMDIKKTFERINTRKQEGDNEKDNFEKEKIEYHEKVREGFLDLAKKLPEYFYIVDASKSKEEVKQDVINVIEKIYF